MGFRVLAGGPRRVDIFSVGGLGGKSGSRDPLVLQACGLEVGLTVSLPSSLLSLVC